MCNLFLERANLLRKLEGQITEKRLKARELENHVNTTLKLM
jgi:hypothetical protein